MPQGSGGNPGGILRGLGSPPGAAQLLPGAGWAAGDQALYCTTRHISRWHCHQSSGRWLRQTMKIAVNALWHLQGDLRTCMSLCHY